jgi:hypothetical protein
VDVGDASTLELPAGAGPGASWVTVLAAAVGTGLVTAAWGRPWMGILTALAVVVATRIPRALLVVDLAAPLLVAVAAARNTQGSLELGWLALALFAAGVVVRALRVRQDARASSG